MLRGSGPVVRGEIVASHSPPAFGPDDKNLYYLLRHKDTNGGPELWRLTLETGKSEAVFPGTSMVSYDVSSDGRQVVYTSVDRDGRSQLWIAPIDRSSPARKIGHSGETLPYFGPRGQILFRFAEGNFNYLEQMNQDGSGRSKVLPYPIIEVQGISPGRRWLMAIASYSEGNSVVPKVVAIPLDGDLLAPYAQAIAFQYGRRAGGSFWFRSKHRRPPRPGEAWLFRLAQEKSCRSFLQEASSRWQNRV